MRNSNLERSSTNTTGTSDSLKFTVGTNQNGEKIGVNPKDLLGILKIQLNLVPPASKAYQALAMEDGAVKYGPYNWRDNKVIASIYVAAAMRHVEMWYDGEDNAEDSRKPHLGHALACIGIIVDALETGNLIDDRPTPGAMAKIIKRWTKVNEPETK